MLAYKNIGIKWIDKSKQYHKIRTFTLNVGIKLIDNNQNNITKLVCFVLTNIFIHFLAYKKIGIK